jgi:hypothetical protein
MLFLEKKITKVLKQLISIWITETI